MKRWVSSAFASPASRLTRAGSGVPARVSVRVGLAFGRGSANLTYYSNDAIQQIQQPNQTTSYTLDAAGRQDTETINTTTPASNTVTVKHFTDSTDAPSFTVTTGGANPGTTKYLPGLNGVLPVTITPDGKQNLQLIDPHGDTVSTITTGTQPTLTAFTAFDEYGNQLNKQNPTNPATASSYGWAGKAEKPTTVSGLILMGARLYNSVTGRFTSRDPVPGGNENAYNYPNDPINGNDWTGCDGIDDFASVLTFGACFVVSFVACAVITIGASILVAISKAQDFVSANKITGLAVGIVYARAVIFAVIKSAIAIGLGRGLELFAKGPVLKLLSDQLGKFGIPVPDLGGIGKLYGSITSDRMITAVVDYLIPDIPNSGNAHLKQPKKN